MSDWLHYCINRSKNLSNILQLCGILGSTESLSLSAQNIVFHSDYTEIPKSKLQVEVY